MSLIAISDLHLAPETTARNELFLNVLTMSKERGIEVVVVGDLFDLWFGWDALTFEFQKPIIRRMIELAKDGLKLSYVEGNRDFGIAPYRGPIFGSVNSLGFERMCGSRRIYFEHGDWINTHDRQYRMWRRVSKNTVSFWIIGHLPSSFLLRMAQRTEQGMRKTNLKYKINYPDSEVDRFCQEKAKAGFDIVVFGHFHEEKEFVVQESGRDVLCYNLPGWEKGLRYLEIPEEGKPVFRDIRG